MPKRAVFERSRRELSLDVSVGVHILILLVVKQSSLESQSRGCAKAPILTVISSCQKSSPWSQGRKTPSGREKRTTYSPYTMMKTAMVQIKLGKSEIGRNRNQKEHRQRKRNKTQQT